MIYVVYNRDLFVMGITYAKDRDKICIEYVCNLHKEDRNKIHIIQSGVGTCDTKAQICKPL